LGRYETGWETRPTDKRSVICITPALFNTIDRRTWPRAAAALLALLACAAALPAQEQRRFIYPEQRRLEVRSPSQVAGQPLPPAELPNTVQRKLELEPWPMALGEAIRVALENAEVVRVLAGQGAVSSGSTIYDPAIVNTNIDQQRARFDPRVFSNNRFFRNEIPQGVFTNGLPPDAAIDGIRRDNFQSQSGISKDFATGTRVSAGVNVDSSDARAVGLPLNPQTASTTEVRVEQPLLEGAGARVNLAPILIARLDTERSFYQLKDSVQDLVNGVTQAYWELAFAEANAWARRQQVLQGREALERAQARVDVGISNDADLAQAAVAYDQFRANSIGADADLIQREATLRNILGLPPADGRQISSVTPLTTQRLEPDWDLVRALAAENRPDLIQRRLLLETDQQQLILARNQTLPELDIVAAHRWNALEGQAFNGQRLSSNGGQFSEYDYAINFSLPLGQRQSRAALRERELALIRDRANLRQNLHAVNHSLAASVRNLAQYYEQYEAFRRTREAARINLERQMAAYRAGGETLYLNVLQAITDWGDSLSNEVGSLALYNAELARLERESGIILENNGVQFIEEAYGSIGPLGRFAMPVCYPMAESPGPNANRPLPPVSRQYHLKNVLRLPPVVDELILPKPEKSPDEPPGARPRLNPPLPEPDSSRRPARLPRVEAVP
jgi:outer membrane protein TolC